MSEEKEKSRSLSSVTEYFEKFNLRNEVEECLYQCFKSGEENPFKLMSSYFAKKANPEVIKEVVGRQVFDSRGNPTIEVDIVIGDEVVARAAGPSGASTGSKEAVEIRDLDEKLFMKKSVFKAVENVNTKINDELKGKEVNLAVLDKALCDLDGDEFKKNLGGNATTAVSFSLAYAGAKLKKTEPFMYLAQQFDPEVKIDEKKFKLPRPMVNIINGGTHAGGDLMIQEFMIIPRGDVPFMKAMQMVCETYGHLKPLVGALHTLAKNVGDEGGFAPPVNTADEALELLEKAIEAAGYKVGEDIFLAIDAAANEFYHKEEKKYEVEKGQLLTSDELVEYYAQMLEKHPALISIEDGIEEEDYEGWQKLVEKLGDKIMIVGDDLYTTNPKFIKEGIEKKWANALLLKVNQIGTISESMAAAKLIFAEKQNVIVSHRSGETCTSLISDLAVAIGAGFIKTGAPARGERVVKYNRLLQIEEYLTKKKMLADIE